MGKQCSKFILEALKNGGKNIQTIKLTFMFEKNLLVFSNIICV